MDPNTYMANQSNTSSRTSSCRRCVNRSEEPDYFDQNLSTSSNRSGGRNVQPSRDLSNGLRGSQMANGPPGVARAPSPPPTSFSPLPSSPISLGHLAQNLWQGNDNLWNQVIDCIHLVNLFIVYLYS